jgi:hypothetical protein
LTTIFLVPFITKNISKYYFSMLGLREFHHVIIQFCAEINIFRLWMAGGEQGHGEDGMGRRKAGRERHGGTWGNGSYHGA